jgi:hypothetical protein
MERALQHMIAQFGKDEPTAHRRADRFLISALRIAAKGTWAELYAEQIINAWERVGKWYE